jgi:hypothetical protein
MNKIALTDCKVGSGKIGYVNSSDLTICYTAYSNVAFGSSDNLAIHQNRMLASNYYTSSFNKSKVVLNECSEDEIDYYNGKVNSYDVLLKSENDKAVYKIYAEKDGRYGIDMTLMKEYEGKKVIIQIDDNTPIRMTIPSSNEAYGTYYKKNNDGTQWKEYKVDLFIKGQEEPFMSGILNCHAAGRMDDPFGMYDMSFMLN